METDENKEPDYFDTGDGQLAYDQLAFPPRDQSCEAEHDRSKLHIAECETCNVDLETDYFARRFGLE